MIAFKGRMILLDIEGTVSPLAFVHDVMFPYARAQVRPFLQGHWDDSRVQTALAQMATDAGASAFADWYAGDADAVSFVVAEVEKLMAVDAKTSGLKLLQGLVWEKAFESGLLRGELFMDVPPAMQSWHAGGIQLSIYSSGSVHAQRLFFSHTNAGDLTPLLTGYYDTAVGSKRESASYTAIAGAADVEVGEVLFVSDVVAELDAAHAAGMKTALALRPGNPNVPPHSHPTLATFSEIQVA